MGGTSSNIGFKIKTKIVLRRLLDFGSILYPYLCLKKIKKIKKTQGSKKDLSKARP